MEENIKKIISTLESKNIALALELIQHELNSNRGLGSYSVYLANRLMGIFPWEIISRLLPPGTNFFETSGWVDSIRSGVPVDTKGSPLPWLNYSCVDFIGKFLMQRSASIFEWGSGYSTLFFCEHAAKIRSCEDNKEWFTTVQTLAENAKNIELVYRPTQAEYINEIDGIFDLIVIDGSHRSECLRVAQNHLKPDGIVLLDNSDDLSLDGAIVQMEKYGFYSIQFSGLIPSYAYKNVSTVFFKDPAILKVGHNGVPSKIPYASGKTCFQAMAELAEVARRN